MSLLHVALFSFFSGPRVRVCVCVYWRLKYHYFSIGDGVQNVCVCVGG